MARKSAKSANIPWTDDELRRSVEVYVLLLRLQLHGGDDRAEPVAQALLGGTLALRNDAAVRYRMRNISAVVRELGAPVLRDFSPAESVGALVRPRIRAMLMDTPEFARILAPAKERPEDDRVRALRVLRTLRQYLEDLEHELSWRGHNRPPDQEEIGLDRAELRSALDDIGVIETQLESAAPDAQVIAARTSNLLGLAKRLAKWLGDRTTKFVDAALIAAGPVAVAKVTGLLPLIVDSIEAVGRTLAH